MPAQRRVQRGLLREDLFTVVSDQVMTDTARYADVLLPATAFPEHAELRAGYGAMVLQYADAAAQPEGEARPNYDVFAELCQRVGVARDDDPTTPEQICAAILPERLHRTLRDEGIVEGECGPTPVQFLDAFPRTADGKVHLVPPHLDREAPEGLYVYRPDPATATAPLALISPATGRTVSSTFGQLRRGQVPLQIHPRDAVARGVTDGEPVRVFNCLGEVRCLARVTEAVRQGVVFLPKGLWRHNTLNGLSANVLVPDDLTDLGGGACFNDARVQVAPLP